MIKTYTKMLKYIDDVQSYNNYIDPEVYDKMMDCETYATAQLKIWTDLKQKNLTTTYERQISKD